VGGIAESMRVRVIAVAISPVDITIMGTTKEEQDKREDRWAETDGQRLRIRQVERQRQRQTETGRQREYAYITVDVSVKVSPDVCLPTLQVVPAAGHSC